MLRDPLLVEIEHRTQISGRLSIHLTTEALTSHWQTCLHMDQYPKFHFIQTPQPVRQFVFMTTKILNINLYFSKSVKTQLNFQKKKKLGKIIFFLSSSLHYISVQDKLAIFIARESHVMT